MKIMLTPTKQLLIHNHQKNNGLILVSTSYYNSSILPQYSTLNNHQLLSQKFTF
ncbi:MAG: hypothetical protein H7101_08115 [Deinococcales bacterium]|nr:hypothetical protein [Chitinophagaceae bacterium]